MASQDDIDRLRRELDEWRRRAEVAEAVAAERLARAETAERALRAAEATLAENRAPGPHGAAGKAAPGADTPGRGAGEQVPRPASLLERWRRYTETIN